MESQANRSNDSLMSLFRDQEQENETMQQYSDYIDKRLQTDLNLEDLFPNREGQTEKGRNILLQVTHKLTLNLQHM